MKVAYPYNETLPKQTAHDVYLFRNCASLSETGASVSLLCGFGGLSDHALYHHYEVEPQPLMHVKRLPIIRKWGPISCNRLFFWMSQRTIEKIQPHIVISSVFKQADYHLAHKQSDIRYVYEVHQLSWYPTCDQPKRRQAAGVERKILEQMDLVTVTTTALKDVLRAPPYALTNAIEVVPLAVNSTELPPPPIGGPLTLMYVGQLYPAQGVDLLLKALARVPNIKLEIVGGTEQQVRQLQALSQTWQLTERVHFHGFVPPHQLPSIVQNAHAFVAPFYAVERMPYVAHTKLLEYASWGRPIVAPHLPVVQEHTQSQDYLFLPGDVDSLTECLQKLHRLSPRPSSINCSWAMRGQTYRNILEQLL